MRRAQRYWDKALLYYYYAIIIEKSCSMEVQSSANYQREHHVEHMHKVKAIRASMMHWVTLDGKQQVQHCYRSSMSKVSLDHTAGERNNSPDRLISSAV